MRRIIVALLFITVAAGAQEAKKSEADAMLESYIEAAKPVAEHARLAGLAGRWKVETLFWMDPQSDPGVATGSGSGRMILGDRFLSLETDVEGPIAMQSLTILGFDRRTSEYTLAGYDTLGTYYITAAGGYDAARRAVVMHGSYAQPPSGREQKYYFVWSGPAANEQVLTLYFVNQGADVRIAETRFTR